MNREEKAEVIASLKNDFTNSQGAFLVNYQGLSVEQVQNLRSNLRTEGAQFKVAKARLMKLAAEGVPEAEPMVPYFKEQVGLIFADEGVPSVAKILKKFAKKNKALEIVAGSLEQKLLDKEAVERIASLPPREVLLAQVCGTLQAPIKGLVAGLNQIPMKLLWALKELEQKKQ